MKVTFIKTRKPKQFSFKTRFYDAQKEADEKRKKEIEDKIKNPDRVDFRKEISQKWGREDRVRSKSRKYALYVYIVILAILLYVILK
ncbi:MAG: hypothetical protein V1783_06620 [Bacteroidota bacterium]|jgi:hypothetical protein